MALGNIRREPRREITESLLGILVVAPLFYLDWHLSAEWSVISNGPPFIIALLLIPVFTVIGLGILFVALLAFLAGTHALGELICDILAEVRLDPRPKNRY